MSKYVLRLMKGRAKIDIQDQSLSYEQGPITSGSVPFDAIRGFYHEKIGAYWNIYVFFEKQPGQVKEVNLIPDEQGADEFLDTLRESIGRPEVDLRGLSQQEISRRLGIKVRSPARTAYVTLLVIYTVGAAVSGVYVFRRAHYLSSGPATETTVEELAAHPQKYDGKKVCVAGLVLPGTARVVTSRQRWGSRTKSYEGYGGFVPPGWSPDKPIQIFVKADEKGEAKRIGAQTQRERRVIVGVFEAGRKPPAFVVERYRRAHLKVDPKGLVRFPPDTLSWWLGLGVVVLVWLILSGATMSVWKRSRVPRKG